MFKTNLSEAKDRNVMHGTVIQLLFHQPHHTIARGRINKHRRSYSREYSKKNNPTQCLAITIFELCNSTRSNNNKNSFLDNKKNYY